MKSKKANLKGFPFKSKALFTIGGGAVLINPAFAQDAQSGDELEEIVVTGLRGSLKASMEIKRDAVGVVDAIRSGMGVGIVPLFMLDAEPQLKPLSPPLEGCESTLWLLAHPESRHLRRIAAVYRHLGESIKLAT